MTEIVPFDFDDRQGDVSVGHTVFNAPTVIEEHEFALDYEEARTVGGDVFDVWRWLCSCGGRGQWQTQSDTAARRAWLRHCGVPDDFVG